MKDLDEGAIDLEADAREMDESNKETALARVSRLALKQMELEDAVAAAELRLKEAQKDLDHVRLNELPSVMKELRIDSITLDDGSSLTRHHGVRANIPKAKAEDAFAWLRANDGGPLIKTNVLCQFGMGEEERARKLAELLSENRYRFAAKEDVHWASLTSFVKERLEGETPLPQEAIELLGVYEFDESKIKRRKA